jgi:two-component system nitrate/nitrite response regulator NarL
VVTPDPVVCRWDSAIHWPGDEGAAIVGVRRHVRTDTDVVVSALRSGTPTIVVGVPASETAVVELLRAGAHEILHRDCDAADLVRAWQARAPRRPATAGSAAAHGPTDPTPRELEVTTLLAQGMTNRQIAAELFISEHTVRNHLGRIFAKLGVGSRTQAVVRAGQVGWLRLPLP